MIYKLYCEKNRNEDFRNVRCALPRENWPVQKLHKFISKNAVIDYVQATDEVLNASRPFLKADESERVKGQLSYIVQDMKEEHLQSRSHGFHK